MVKSVKKSARGHVNKNSKGDSVKRCATRDDGNFVFPNMRPHTGRNRSALLSKWYHRLARVETSDTTWTYLSLAVFLRRARA